MENAKLIGYELVAHPRAQFIDEQINNTERDSVFTVTTSQNSLDIEKRMLLAFRGLNLPDSTWAMRGLVYASAALPTNLIPSSSDDKSCDNALGIYSRYWEMIDSVMYSYTPDKDGLQQWTKRYLSIMKVIAPILNPEDSITQEDLRSFINHYSRILTGLNFNQLVHAEFS